MGGEAGADGSILKGIPALFDVDSLLGRGCDMLWRILEDRNGSIGMAEEGGKGYSLS